MNNPTPFKTIAAAARAAGIERQNLHKMLSGKEKPGLPLMLRFCKAWQMPLKEVIEIFYPDEYQEYKFYL